MFVIIYIVTFITLLVLAFGMMAQGFTAMNTKPKRKVHPEMKDVKPGDELMGISFENSDEMNDELNKRIKELQ